MLLSSQITRFLNQLYLEENDEKAWFFACWYRFVENRSWMKNIGVDMVKNGCGHSFLKTLKLVACQRKMNEVNWLLVCSYKFIKAKCYFNDFWVVVFRNGCGPQGLGTLKSAASQGPIDEMSWFLCAGTNLGKLKVALIIIS